MKDRLIACYAGTLLALTFLFCSAVDVAPPGATGSPLGLLVCNTGVLLFGALVWPIAWVKQKYVLVGCYGVLFLVALAFLHFQPLDRVGPLGYLKLRLGMNEQEITEILREPGGTYRPVRHIGGITSPGWMEVLTAQSGLPYADLMAQLRGDVQHRPQVTVKQWWWGPYAIDVAFDENATAIGIYLCRIRSFGFY